MIVGITGAICSGKAALALYLVQTHGFEAINIQEIFKLRLSKRRREHRERIEAAKQRAKQTRAKKLNNS